MEWSWLSLPIIRQRGSGGLGVCGGSHFLWRANKGVGGGYDWSTFSVLRSNSGELPFDATSIHDFHFHTQHYTSKISTAVFKFFFLPYRRIYFGPPIAQLLTNLYMSFDQGRNADKRRQIASMMIFSFLRYRRSLIVWRISWDVEWGKLQHFIR